MRRHFITIKSTGLGKSEKITPQDIVKNISTPIDSRVILEVASRNGYNLTMLNSLDELLSDSIELNKWYLHSIGNKTIRKPSGETVKSGHYILVKLELIDTGKGKSYPVMFFVSSQQLFIFESFTLSFYEK